MHSILIGRRRAELSQIRLGRLVAHLCGFITVNLGFHIHAAVLVSFNSPAIRGDAEFSDELARAWVEMYKKSATTLVLLRFIADEGPVDTSTIADEVARRTGWELADRALYRSLKRLGGLGLVTVHQRPGRRTGAQRHEFEISARGSAYLQRIERSLITTAALDDLL